MGLHSPSSYRFERGVDPLGVEWASRRCCQLIVELAGGQLAPGILDVGALITRRPAITLRLSQLPRVLGIEISGEEVERILTALGNERTSRTRESLEFVPPSWRRDLTREIDLIEEVARIHGYDQIPEDVGVPMAPSHRTHEDRVLERVAGNDGGRLRRSRDGECRAPAVVRRPESLVQRPAADRQLADAQARTPCG